MTSDKRPVTVVVTWEDAAPAEACSGRVGLQDRSAELAAPTSSEDNRVRFEVPATAVGFIPPHDLRGPYVHGRPGARFLYLSFTDGEAAPWARRVKIMVPPDLDASTNRVAVTIRDSGGSRADLVIPWAPT